MERKENLGQISILQEKKTTHFLLTLWVYIWEHKTAPEELRTF